MRTIEDTKISCRNVVLGTPSRRLLAALTLAAAWTLAQAPLVAAADPNTCAAGKVKCATTFATTAFKCYGPLAKKGVNGSTGEKAESCIFKGRQKLGSAIASGPGCIEKLEAKQKPEKPETMCLTSFDEYDFDELVKDFTLEVIEDTLMDTNLPFGSSCNAGKIKCVSKLFKGLLGCWEKAIKKGEIIEDACLAKAQDKFMGDEPGRSCFAKLEAKQKLGKLSTLCHPDGVEADALVSVLVDAFVNDVVAAALP
jgi:hypothetical protein